MSEREWSVAENVCPVVWSFAGVVNIYRRAQQVARVNDAAYPPLRFGDVQLRVDPKPENVGILDGRLVWLDFDQSQGSCQVCCYTHGPLHPAPATVV